VNVGTYGAPTWTGVFGVTDFKSTFEPDVKETSDFDSGGAKDSSVPAYGWSLDLKLERKTKAADATAYDVGQEALRAASLLMGESNKVDIRFYEVTASGPKVEAYRGYALVLWKPVGGGMADLDTVVVQLIGKGARTAITHPDAGGAVPTLTSIAPATDVEAGGALVEIHGTGFFAAGVDDVVSIAFGVTDAPTFITESDNILFVVAPAHAAGTVAVTVTNATGVSTVTQNFVYTVA